MEITNQAKLLIQSALEDANANAVRVKASHSCCGTNLQFELTTLISGEPAEIINGLSVLMDVETQKQTESVTIDAEKGQLKLIDNNAPCCG